MSQQLELLSEPFVKVTDTYFEVYEGKKKIGYIELEKLSWHVNDELSLNFKSTVGNVFGGGGAISMSEIANELKQTAEYMKKVHRRRIENEARR